MKKIKNTPLEGLLSQNNNILVELPMQVGIAKFTIYGWYNKDGHFLKMSNSDEWDHLCCRLMSVEIDVNDLEMVIIPNNNKRGIKVISPEMEENTFYFSYYENGMQDEEGYKNPATHSITIQASNKQLAWKALNAFWNEDLCELN